VDRFLHPVGPEPAAVYWRRRAAVLGGLVVVIVVLVMIIKALAGGGAPRGAASPSPTAPKSLPAVSASPAAVAPACTAQQLTGGALAADADILLAKSPSDKAGYGPSELVTLVAQVKNTSTKDCTLINNPHNVVLSVVSGSDRIFNSADCAAKTPAESGDSIIIKAGETADIPISWEPVRSQQGCPEITDTPFRAKDATYRASVTIVGVPSDETQFLLTP
jgi:hypothetical protein